jgi:hypothetical protein
MNTFDFKEYYSVILGALLHDVNSRLLRDVEEENDG